MATVGIHMALYSGQTGMKIYLYSGGSLLNSGGDTLTESGSTGYFDATVDESLSATYSVTVEDSGGTPVYEDKLYEGETVVGVIPDNAGVNIHVEDRSITVE